MADIQINFVGAWRFFLGVRTVRADVDTMDEARDYIEKTYRPVFEKKLQSMGVNEKQSVWDNSSILLNGRTAETLHGKVFQDGDALDLLPLIAGG